MNKAFKKILERLEEDARFYNSASDVDQNIRSGLMIAKGAVQEVAEEYKDKPNIIDGLKIFLQEKFNYCAEQAEMNLEAECNSEIASYFRDRKELYLDRANIYGEVMREIDRLAVEYNNGWIPCSDRLPEEYGEYIVWWTDITKSKYYEIVEYEPSNGWIGDIPQAVEGKYSVIAWQPLPEPYKERD